MVWEHELTVRLHQQDEADYCAAACAQMIYNYSSKILEDQSTLYQTGRQNCKPAHWGEFYDPQHPSFKGIDPTGLEFTLNSLYRKLHVLLPPFSVTELTIPYMLSEAIANNLISFNVPIPVLVYDNAAHWVVVRGVSLESNPGIALGSMVIRGFWINNPWPVCRYTVPHGYTAAPPHAEADACGCGLMPNYGKPNEFISRNLWLSTYLKTTSFPGTSRPQAVAILLSLPTIDLKKKNKKPWIMRPFIPKETLIISPEKIKKSVINEIKEFGLDSKESIVEALNGSEPADPTLVQRLDLPGSYYYIVPLKRQKLITSIAIMNAGDGKLDGFTAYERPIRKFLMSRKEVAKKISGQIIDMGENTGSLIFQEGTFDISPTMVWRPCRESLSPYYPFHVATIGDKHVYVGYDGTVYPALHDNKRFG
jgi:hypothetical protein